MRYIFLSFVAFVGRIVFSLRYRIEIKGWESLKSLKSEKGILFLPNHGSRLDPLILIFYLWPRYRVRSISVEYVCRMAFISPMIKLLRTVPIPNLENYVNEFKLFKAKDALNSIIKGLDQGENFLFYPSGRLKDSGFEKVGGASGLSELLKKKPKASLVLVRQTGYWGSRFSLAFGGDWADLSQSLWDGTKGILQSFLFFGPRRKILIEFQVQGEEFPRQASRFDLNRYLEKWYNQYPDSQGLLHESEPCVLIPSTRWGKPPVHRSREKSGEDQNGKREISASVQSEVYQEISTLLNRVGMDLNPSQKLSDDLGMDSVEIAGLVAFLSSRFDRKSIRPEELKTVQDILEAAEGVKIPSAEKCSYYWNEEKGRPAPAIPVGRTLPEAFLRTCQRMDAFTACADDTSGILTYRRLKRASLVLAHYFRTIPEQNIGVMLPASAGAFVLLFGLMLAQKTPVLLNWTLGPRYLEQMAQIGEIQRVISSWKFLDRLNQVQFGSLLHKIEFLEDIRSNLKPMMKLQGLMNSVKSLELDKIDENETAVILFTSGTEGKPKAVPLTHRNILSNQTSLMKSIQFQESDVLLSALPPFHALGLTVVGIFPLLCGLKTAFYPNPIDSVSLAERIHRWKASWFVSPPSFLNKLFSTAISGQLDSIRYFVSGGERTPSMLYRSLEHLGLRAQLIEAYGVTECSPCVSIGGLGLPQKGVGRILPGIEACAIDSETGEKLKDGSTGEICISGPNVFKGYLHNAKSPFIQIENKKWYRTGDIGSVDAEGNLFITARLSRSIKVGGEMISFGVIEEAISEELIRNHLTAPNRESVAVCSHEFPDGKSELTLFTTVPMDSDYTAKILRKSGLSNLIKISKVKHIKEIPTLNSGKIDYKKLSIN